MKVLVSTPKTNLEKKKQRLLYFHLLLDRSIEDKIINSYERSKTISASLAERICY